MRVPSPQCVPPPVACVCAFVAPGVPACRYLLFAAEPYETIGFKIPNMEVDKSEGKFYTDWNREKLVFTVRVCVCVCVWAYSCVAVVRACVCPCACVDVCVMCCAPCMVWLWCAVAVALQ